MLCCNNHHYSPVETLQNRRIKTSYGSPRGFPGSMRNVCFDRPPPDSILFRTAGTALQAIPRDAALQPNMVAVSVPENCVPGQELLVLSPDKTGACLRVTIPDGAFPGRTFLVQMKSPVVVAGIPVQQQDDDHDHELHLTNVSSAVPSSLPRENVDESEFEMHKMGDGGSNGTSTKEIC